MNKQILKLAKQAGLIKWGLLPSGAITPDHESVVKAKKFAELIVLECINEIHAADLGDLLGKGYYLDSVAEHIEKHFGIK